jgi:hypothetical protein
VESPNVYAILDNYYLNQAHVWVHELFHVDWVSLNGNPHMTDIKLGYRDTQSQVLRWFTAYAPYKAKGLGRFTGFWTLQNADPFALYALARYRATGPL